MIALTITTRTQTGFTLGMSGQDGGETVFELEINRAEDFASDDSIFITGHAAGAISATNMPSGTIYFCRMRSTNLTEPGAWSNVVMVSTLQATAPAPYSGSSIEPAIIVVPEPLKFDASSQLQAGSSLESLVDPDPNAVTRFNTAAAPSFYFQTPGRPYDFIGILGALVGTSAQWTLKLSDNPDPNASPGLTVAASPVHLSSGLNQRQSYHGAFFLGSPVTYRYGWISFPAANLPKELLLRNLIVGLQRKTHNYVRGSNQTAEDLSTLTRNARGTPFVEKGWRGRTVEFGLEWLAETEYEAKWSDIERLVGTTDPVLAIPNSAPNEYLHDRLLFGPITSSRGEHTRARKYARSFTISSIY